MKKDLPHVFAAKIDKPLGSTKSFYSNSNGYNKPEKKFFSTIDINKKINELLNSDGFVYKADVDIRTKDVLVTKRIIGRNKDNILTIDGELIPINQIIDIYVK